MFNYEFPGEPMSVKTIVRKTLISYVKNFPLILIFGIGVYFAYRYFYLTADFKTPVKAFLEFIKASPFFNALNAYGALQIFLEPMTEVSPYAVFMKTYWPVIVFAIFVQPFVFGSVTLAAGREYRVGKTSFKTAALDLIKHYLRFFKLSFTQIYIGSFITFILGALILVAIFVFSAVTAIPNILSLTTSIVVGIAFVFIYFSFCMAYAVSALEGRLAYKAIGRSAVLIKEDLRKSAAVMGIFIGAPLLILALIFFDPGIVVPYHKDVIMTAVSAVLMPFMFIAPVHLYASLNALKESRIKDEIALSQAKDTDRYGQNSKPEEIK